MCLALGPNSIDLIPGLQRLFFRESFGATSVYRAGICNGWRMPSRSVYLLCLFAVQGSLCQLFTIGLGGPYVTLGNILWVLKTGSAPACSLQALDEPCRSSLNPEQVLKTGKRKTSFACVVSVQFNFFLFFTGRDTVSKLRVWPGEWTSELPYVFSRTHLPIPIPNELPKVKFLLVIENNSGAR